MISFGTPTGSARMRRRDQRGAAGAAGGNDAGDVALAAQPAGEGFGHGRHRRAAVGRRTRAAPPRAMVERDLLRRDVAAESLPLVETSTRRARKPGGDDVADEPQLLALGVERADDQHGRRAGRCGRRGSRRAARVLQVRHADRERARRGFDARDRRRLRPARRRRRVGDVDSDRRRAPRRGAAAARRAAA